MKLVVFSDTHGNNAGMLRAAARVSPDVLVHLGDYWRDAAALAEAFPDIPLHRVPGNCDFASRSEADDVFMAGAATVLATHGHIYAVKYGLYALEEAGRGAGASLVLYGHTHTARIDYLDGMTLLNPGTAGMGAEKTFAVVEVNASGGTACRILNI